MQNESVIFDTVVFFRSQGMCEKTIQDSVERFWDIIEEININKVLRFLRDNIVSKYRVHHQLPVGKQIQKYIIADLSSQIFFAAVTVVVLTAIFWIPASCIISFFDRRQRREELKEYQWSQALDLIHPSDRRRVIHIRYRYPQ